MASINRQEQSFIQMILSTQSKRTTISKWNSNYGENGENNKMNNQNKQNRKQKKGLPKSPDEIGTQLTNSECYVEITFQELNGMRRSREARTMVTSTPSEWGKRK